MKRKILYICLAILMLIDGALVNYILEREPVCDRTHLSDVDRTKDIVPDEETAIRIAEANLKTKISGWNSHGDIDYQIEVIYDEPSYEWIVIYEVAPPEGKFVLDGTKVLGVRRDYGHVYWYADWYKWREDIGYYIDF